MYQSTIDSGGHPKLDLLLNILTPGEKIMNAYSYTVWRNKKTRHNSNVCQK